MKRNDHDVKMLNIDLGKRARRYTIRGKAFSTKGDDGRPGSYTSHHEHIGHGLPLSLTVVCLEEKIGMVHGMWWNMVGALQV